MKVAGSRLPAALRVISVILLHPLLEVRLWVKPTSESYPADYRSGRLEWTRRGKPPGLTPQPSGMMSARFSRVEVLDYFSRIRLI